MNIVDKFKKIFFYRMHPEAALRYLPIVDLLKKLKIEDRKILEIGSGSYGITPYLNRAVDGLDTNFDEPEYPLLRRIAGSATRIPIKSKKYDVVILSDVLEHIPPKLREIAIKEALRVSKRYVIISGPFGKEAAIQDKKLANYSVEKIGRMHIFFEEHLKYGLPAEDDIKKYLENSKRVRGIRIIGRFFNLKMREILMRFFITDNKLVFYFYLKGLMLFVWFFRMFNKPPCYRTVFLITLG